MTRIAVLVGTRIDPVSGRATRSAGDAAAAALALRLSAEPQLVTAGDMPEAVARDYLALGAPCLTVLRAARRGSDFAALLADTCASASLVLTGRRGESELGSGLLPYGVARALRRPLIADVIDVQPDGDGWLVRQALPRGARRRLRLTGPAVLVVADRAAGGLRYSFDAARRGRIDTLDVPPAPAAADATATEAWHYEPARRQLTPLAARTAQSGHARMSVATGSAPAGSSNTVIREGGAADMARTLLEHLRDRGLVAF
jgi:electron transfer flavoprotein beta subunit